MDYRTEFGFSITTNGHELFAACAATGKGLELTRVAVGSGRVPNDVELSDVHALYDYVTDGAVGERIHENNYLYLTVQYANNMDKTIPDFVIAEFMVYAKHPKTGEDIDIIYGSLGSYLQPVPAYNENLPTSVFSFPLIIALSDKIKVSVSAAPGLVTYNDLQELMNKGFIGISRSEIVIPASSWVDNEAEDDAEIGDEYPFRADVMGSNITERMTPIVTLYPECLDIARSSEVCPTATSFDGFVRLYAKSKPSEDLSASLSLIGGAGYLDSTPGSSVPGGSGNISSTDISTITVLDRAAYDALPKKDATTLYLIRG